MKTRCLLNKKGIILLVLLLLGISQNNNAVMLSDDGMGQVLLFPYFTVRNNYDTLISIGNLSDQIEVININFRDGAHGMEVLQFNAFLKPNSTFVAAVTTTDYGDGQMIIGDDACTYPFIKPGNNINFQYPQTVDISEFTTEGYIEVIGSGTIDPESEYGQAITSDCESLNQTTEFYTGDYFAKASNRLYGNFTLIDVASGIAFSHDVVALKYFSDQLIPPFYSNLLETAPGLHQASPAESIVLTVNEDGEPVYLRSAWENAIDAVSAVLISGQLHMDFDINPIVAAETNIIMTLPLKTYSENASYYRVRYTYSNRYGDEYNEDYGLICFSAIGQ